MKRFNLGSYFLITSGFGFIFKLAEIQNAQVMRDTGKITPMLVGEKLTVAMIYAVTVPYCFPYYTYNCLNKLDIYMRGDNINDYYMLDKKEKKLTDYCY